MSQIDINNLEDVRTAYTMLVDYNGYTVQKQGDEFVIVDEIIEVYK